MSALLELRRVTRRFGGLVAVDDVSLSIAPGEIVGLIGPNGAGKTTLVNLITGVVPPSSGRVLFDEHDVTGQKPFQAARRGIARTFQIVQPFPQMTALENVAAAALFGGGAASRQAAEREAAEHLAFVGLPLAKARQPAATLTLPDRKRLELAKSLAMRPRLLMLDEVNAGLNSGEIAGAVALIRRIAGTGVTVVVIEHLMKVVLSLCARVVVLHHGRLIADGVPQAVVRDPQVVEAYLGRRYAEKAAAHA